MSCISYVSMFNPLVLMDESQQTVRGFGGKFKVKFYHQRMGNVE